MSHAEMEEVESNLNDQVIELSRQVEAIAGPARSLQRLAPAIYTLVAAAISFGIWIGSLEWRVQAADADTVRHDSDLRSLQLWRERSDAQVVTAGEIASIVAGLKEALSTLDKRQARTEDGIDNLSEQLDRIEARLSQKQAGL